MRRPARLLGYRRRRGARGRWSVGRGGRRSRGHRGGRVVSRDTVKHMTRPILLGIVGDSATGKTTLTRGLVRILGEAQVAHVSADHYHRYDRKQRVERGLTPL